LRVITVRYFFIVLCLGLVTACDEPVTGPTVPLDSGFELAPGNAVEIETASLYVKFNGVRGDSRCPADAICITGGDAIVGITAWSNGMTSDYELHTGDLRPVRHNSFSIALVQLQPYPFSGRTIAPGDYRATLRVSR
jgi:hypothetical protein